MRLGAAELQQLERANQPGWVAAVLASAERRTKVYSEPHQRIAAAVIHFHEMGKKWVRAREIGDLYVKLTWKEFGGSNNGLGDLLGGRGLRLRRINVIGGHAYIIPDGGITLEYLRSVGYDV